MVQPNVADLLLGDRATTRAPPGRLMETNLSMSIPIVIDNFLPAALYELLLAQVRNAPLTAGAKSNAETDPYGHLTWKPIYDRRKNLADISSQLPHRSPLTDAWICVRKRAGKPCKLVRAYVNAYAYGMDGYFHTDSEREGERTVIIYLCDIWDRDWAGETVCMDGNRLYSVLPAPNRALVIPSNMPHCARGVSRKCSALRTVLVFKLRPTRSEEFERLSTWLTGKGALDVAHGKSDSLHDHLVRVFSALEAKSLPRHVCLGGGLHSIYGTNAFRRQLVAPTDSARAAVAGEFGREAEELAYQFSILNRPQTLEDSVDYLRGDLVLRYTHNGHYIASAEVVRHLCLIECANLDDQKSLDKWPNLSKLWKGKQECQPSPTTISGSGS